MDRFSVKRSIKGMIHYWENREDDLKMSMVTAMLLEDNDYIEVMNDHLENLDPMFDLFHHPPTNMLIILAQEQDLTLPDFVALAYKCSDFIDYHEFLDVCLVQCHGTDEEISSEFQRLWDDISSKFDGNPFIPFQD